MADNVADKTIGELDNIGTLPSGLPNIQPSDLFLAEQNGEAVNVTGEQLTAFINRAVVGVDVDYIAATETGSADYNSETGLLTLHIPIGDGIASIHKTAASGATDTYTITLDTGSTFAFQVTNGSNIQSVTWDSYRNYNGRRIDKYKITLTDGQTFDFEVTNGKDGEGQVNSIMGLEPTGTDGDFTTYQMMHTLLPIMMPVGYVYMSTANQSPTIRYAQYVSASEWAWEKIEGRYLVAAGKADSSDADCPTYYAGARGSYKTTIDFSDGDGAAKIGHGNNPYNYIAMDSTGESFTDISHVGQISANWTDTIPSGLQTNGAGMAALTGTQDIIADQLRYGFYVWIRTA